ncbi:MAG: acyltransferase [Leptothrix sp. (in: Bacteria)]|nr:acyltransferase [Leptothrix sp. (in: b-proteobacteria)]
MKSSSGQYYIGLDHLRALAVLMVFSWHFIYSHGILPLDGSAAPRFAPLSLLTQGYTGVSLFMVLSGYIFARLTDGQQLMYGRFLINRALRLLPLLSVVMALAYVKSIITHDGLDVPHRLLWGWLAPVLPQGGWSVTVEAHFYVMLPVILWIAAKSRAGLLAVVLATIALRCVVYALDGPMEYLSYTMVGRLDQFLLGCLAYQWRHLIQGRHAWWSLAAIVFCAFISYVDHQGSMFSKNRDMSPWWIFFSTVEGAFYGLSVAWYDTSFKHPTPGRASKLVAMVGRYSYSIYMLHAFVVFKLADVINRKLIDIENTYLALTASAICLLLFLPVAALSYRLIEAPFLKLRVIYTKPKPAAPTSPVNAPKELQVRQAA